MTARVTTCPPGLEPKEGVEACSGDGGQSVMTTESETPPVVAVVVAAGSSRRFGSDKLAVALGGRTVLEWSMAGIRAACPDAPIALVVAPDRVAQARRRWEGDSIVVVVGGRRRQDSVKAGVDAVASDPAQVVVIHDGARPFVPAADVSAVVAAATRSGAALLVAAIVDTIKEVSAQGRVTRTIPRDHLVRSLTPQAFLVGVLRQAWAGAPAGEWTDEAALVEACGREVVAVPGDPRNLKVTSSGDAAMLAGLLSHTVRVGHGLDIHPFAPHRPLWLCGIEVPSEVGLAGHSDADVALHAVTDAVLGACGCGDIGEHFPPSDPQWRGVASKTFLRHAVGLAAERGFTVGNCDLTVLAEQPRIGPFREAMACRLAELLGVDRGAVNVKATTCEGLGFVGRREGIVAEAVVTLELR